ncbi:MAG: IS3 family transposase, partial [Betaproteobacteria bacterium]|nr:IS3 family transposase [Betaproteobacteria bacterium]
MIAPGSGLPVARQAGLPGVSRGSAHYRPKPGSGEEPGPLKRLDEHFTGNPICGSRRLQQMPEREGIPAGRRRLRRPMKK